MLILGSTGLLGNTLTKYFLLKEDYDVFGTIRDYSKLEFFKKKYHRHVSFIKQLR